MLSYQALNRCQIGRIPKNKKAQIRNIEPATMNLQLTEVATHKKSHSTFFVVVFTKISKEMLGYSVKHDYTRKTFPKKCTEIVEMICS